MLVPNQINIVTYLITPTDVSQFFKELNSGERVAKSLRYFGIVSFDSLIIARIEHHANIPPRPAFAYLQGFINTEKLFRECFCFTRGYHSVFTKNRRLFGAFRVFTANKIQCRGDSFVSFIAQGAKTSTENNGLFSTR